MPICCRYVGDPRFSKIPVAGDDLEGACGERAKLIDAERATCSVVPSQLISTAKMPGADTIYLSVVDRDGNMVSFIQSNYLGFGSGVVPDGTGFMLHNRGGLFTLERDTRMRSRLASAPSTRLFPALCRRAITRIAFGIMGGWNQAQAHAQFVSNVVDHGMNIQAALEAPRFTKLTFEGCDVQIESRVPEAVRSELSDLDMMCGSRRRFRSESAVDRPSCGMARE